MYKYVLKDITIIYCGKMTVSLHLSRIFNINNRKGLGIKCHILLYVNLN